MKETNWDDHLHRGGYIWHTTGSGKTMSSFKSAELVAKSGDADKVVFLLDRIELAPQSLDEYRGFAGESDEIQDTADTSVLLAKLKSIDNDDRLIVTSIQKMSNLKEGASISNGGTITKELLDKIGKKRLVFIIDECHRSVFGDMLVSIKHTFPVRCSSASRAHPCLKRMPSTRLLPRRSWRHAAQIHDCQWDPRRQRAGL